MGDDLRQRTQFLGINRVGSMNKHTRHSLENCLRYATLRKCFPWSDCVGCIYERKRKRGLTVWDVLTTGNDFAYIIVFLALLYVFLYLSARQSHTTSFCRACVQGGHSPDGSWVVWEGLPYRPLTR